MSDNKVPDSAIEDQEVKSSTSSAPYVSQCEETAGITINQGNGSDASVCEKIKTYTFTNSTIQGLTSQCENLKVDNDSGSQKQVFKKKNANKKEKLKKLEMPQASQHIAASKSDIQTNCNGPQDISPLQELFLRQISPLYATTSSRYLENLANLPHYQYMQELQLRGDKMHQNLQYLHNSPSIPSTPRSPQYLQNAMQHPLLNKSFSMESNGLMRNTMQHGESNEQRGSPRHSRKKKKKEKTDDTKFDPYISISELEKGLKCNRILEGNLRINSKQFQHAYVSSSDRSLQDFLIDGIKNRNRALEGDIVMVEILSDGETDDPNDVIKQKKAKVVYIKEKVHTRTCIGTLKLMPDMNRQRALFVPRDHRIPRLNIPCTSWPDNFYNEAKKYENTMFLAKIVEWTDTRYAIGTIVCLIGQSGDMISENKAILAQNDLDITPFGPEVRHLYPRLDYTIPEEEINKREDCRKQCIFSIDPSNCRDIDDAVSCQKLENGNYEIGVHISDVAYFLTENTILDERVAEKATTIYMVEKAYHMLPDDLCMLCSLFPGVDKLAFSVFWEITETGEVLSHRFAKTIINSCGQLAYDHAQAVLEDKEDASTTFPELYNGFQYGDIRKVIKVLGNISAIFRKKRFDNGALRIDQPKVSFRLSTVNGMPESFWLYESKESHQLIEEFMLLANMTVAKRIFDDFPKLAFLRCHPAPSGYMLRQLAKALKPMGIELDIGSAGDLHRSLLPYVGPDNTDRGRALVLNMLCAKPMTRAKYFCAGGCEDEEFSHYALNVPLYTHFTSPIRRYADIMVHRLLAASLKFREVPKWEVDKVRSIASQCNKQKYNAKKAGEMSVELYILKYIELHSPLITEAVVVDVREKYIDVIIISVCLNRRIFFNNDFPGDYKCIKNDGGAKLAKMELTWKATEECAEVKQLIEVFSILKVEMHKGDEMLKVETKLLRPESDRIG